MQNNEGCNVLQQAVKEEKINFVHLLITKGRMDFNTAETFDDLPFFLALNSNRKKMVYYFLNECKQNGEKMGKKFDTSIFYYFKEGDANKEKRYYLPSMLSNSQFFSQFLFDERKLFEFIDLYEEDEEGQNVLDILLSVGFNSMTSTLLELKKGLTVEEYR